VAEGAAVAELDAETLEDKTIGLVALDLLAAATDNNYLNN